MSTSSKMWLKTLLTCSIVVRWLCGLNKHDILLERVRLSILSVMYFVKLCFEAFNLSYDIGLIFTGGFYTQLFESSNSYQPLRIISLNTNLYYSPNKVTVNITDPANQFAWLEGILETSSQKNEKVGIRNRTYHYLFQFKKKKKKQEVEIMKVLTWF